MEEITMKDMVNICKQYGFIYQGSEIYGGLANTWDYGPLGSLLKDNIKKTWKKRFIQERDDAYEVDAAILMHPRVWEASGHVQSFSDPLIDCKNCKMRHRVDNLISEYNPELDVDAMTEEEILGLPMGAYLMTLEVGIRFLGDYLNGDVYFQIHYPEQNRDRARNQLKLVADMDKKMDQMNAIVRKYL